MFGSCRNAILILPLQVVELHGNGITYMGSVVEKRSESTDDEIYVNSKLIHHLGWSSQVPQIIIKPIKRPAMQIKTLFLRPCSANDWDVIVRRNCPLLFTTKHN